MRSFAAVLALLALSAAPAAAQPAQRCSHDTFDVGGKALAVTVCAAAPAGGKVAVSESFKGGSGSFSRSTAIDVLGDAAVSRAVDDAGLNPLGINGTLHLTLAYRGGAVTIEHALLLPGATPLK
jgi:hypothetical protein